jgi:hypothetical protein
VSIAEIVNAYHVWVTDHGGGTRFAPKTFDCLTFQYEVGMQQLDSDFVANVQATGAVDSAHGSLAQKLHQFIFCIEDTTEQVIRRLGVGNRFLLVDDSCFGIQLPR